MLADFLRFLAGTEFEYSATDCAMPLARWWQINHGGPCPAAGLGDYCDSASCHALLARHGGLLRLVFGLARQVGARRTHDPKPGDFAVVRYGRHQFGAIRAPSGKWAIKCRRGLRFVRGEDCRVLMMWSI